MTPDKQMQQIDRLLAHVWMVRTFLKHSEEAEEDEELQEVHRELYDYMHALGGPWQQQDSEKYLKQARKKLRRLRSAKDLFAEIQPEISTHTNFLMARQSLTAAVEQIEQILAGSET